MDPTIAAEEAFHYTCLAPATQQTIDSLTRLEPETLALMHGPTHRGPGGSWLRDLSSYYVTLSAAVPT